ncbi:hypothetical protein [Natronorubrum texcoconense]|uniref:Uncharacterized protein n=1 Tax=Natronorubrum texcoconense TaxID=1095776 RepID=A0A1G8T779_9EURY|nr:hypothetical protein [Natronorubrum texcoconense]SDJ37241.1 hypothetical protein SAMN04515672_0346 [Natronorubrum texcoconense]
MSSDEWWSSVDFLAARWSALERDWKSVVVGGVIVALIGALELRIPW